jgi:hypothetical protein
VVNIRSLKTVEAVNDDQGRASVVEARKKFKSDVKALTLHQYSAALTRW